MRKLYFADLNLKPSRLQTNVFLEKVSTNSFIKLNSLVNFPKKLLSLSFQVHFRGEILPHVLYYTRHTEPMRLVYRNSHFKILKSGTFSLGKDRGLQVVRVSRASFCNKLLKHGDSVTLQFCSKPNS